MGSSNEHDQITASLQHLVATLDAETLARILQDLGRGKEQEVARAMMQSIRKK